MDLKCKLEYQYKRVNLWVIGDSIWFIFAFLIRYEKMRKVNVVYVQTLEN